MCGRYTLRVTGDELAERFDAKLRAEFEPTYNAAPRQNLPVVREDAENGNDAHAIDNLRWGLVPSWADDDKEGNINARAETVAEKPSFAEAYEKRRCLVPADGFYEWTEEGPWYVEFERVVALAGIWERWVPETRQAGLGSFEDESDGARKDSRGRDELESFAILTTEPNEKVARLHHRMAVVLGGDEENRWLDGTLGAEELGPRDESADVRRVSERVNSPENDDASLVAGVE
jgi:putative SOS response-associated peptidase YedK